MLEEWTLKIKKYCTYSKDELFAVIIASIVFGFMLSFNDWDRSSAAIGIYHFITSIAVALISLFLHTFVLKVLSIRIGYKAKIKLSLFWLFSVLAFSFASLMASSTISTPITFALVLEAIICPIVPVPQNKSITKPSVILELFSIAYSMVLLYNNSAHFGLVLWH